MKKHLLSVILIFLLFNVYGQSKMKKQRSYLDYNVGYNNLIKINPLSLGVGNLSLSYERFLSERFSLQLQAGYWAGGRVEGTRWTGYSVTPEVRWYMTDELRPSGLYSALFGRFQHVETDMSRAESETKINRFGGGLVLGYQFLLGTRISVDLFAGPQYMRNSIVQRGTETGDYWYFNRNLGARAGATLGVVF